MSDINWKENAIATAFGCQFIIVDGNVYDEHGREFGDGWDSGLVDAPYFQINEIATGDFIPASELDTEQKYNEVVDVFGLFGITMSVDHRGFLAENSLYLVVCDEGYAYTNEYIKRKLTYSQIIAIGKLKRMMLEREKSAPKTTPDLTPDFNKASSSKYEREITDRQGNTSIVDVYDVLKAFNVTCPATQHAVKKLLCSGLGGHKDLQTDLVEAKESIIRAIELN